MAESATGFSPAASTLLLPRKVGRRLLLKLVARGGMGDVYLGATTGIEGAERPCIVKTVRRDHVHDGSFLARFLDEARVQAQLQHPGVAQVLEAATDDDGEPYTVVEYVEGRSLADVRQRAIQTGIKIGWADAAAVAIEIAQALAHVHERPGPDGSPLGIVHRDLSPQNVMVGHAGEIKLIDFGTARGHNRRCHTVAGVVFAKPGYVAPEVARQQVGDGRIDLYALGVMLWELCSGRRFLTTDPQRHLDDVAAGKVVLPPIGQACGAPPELDAVIARLTKNDPDERYSRASLAVPDLARLLAAAPSGLPGERGVRARVAVLMRALWPHEPARTRAEFVRLLRDARQMLADGRSASVTPTRESVVTALGGAAAQQPAGEGGQLPGTPYRLIRRIGEGASSVVWEAEHVELARRVALKVLTAEQTASLVGVESFRREARAVAQLSHPNLVQILDFGRSRDDRMFLAMELLAGQTLDAKLEHGALGWIEASRVALQVCHALAAAHAAGLVHRDIKPQNLFVTQDGTVKLLDFGVMVAHGSGIVSRATRTNERLPPRGFAIFGTPEYMAPEQVADEAVDGRSDVYALGCVLYEMLSGAAPFAGSSVVVMGKQLRETPRPLRGSAVGRTLPKELEAVVLQAMAKAPESRFSSAALMGAALDACLRAPGRRKGQGRLLAAGLLSVAGILAVGSAFVASVPGLRRPTAAPIAHLVPPSNTAASPPGERASDVTPTMTDAPTAAVAAPAAAPAVQAIAAVEPSPGHARDRAHSRVERSRAVPPARLRGAER